MRETQGGDARGRRKGETQGGDARGRRKGETQGGDARGRRKGETQGVKHRSENVGWRCRGENAWMETEERYERRSLRYTKWKV